MNPLRDFFEGLAWLGLILFLSHWAREWPRIVFTAGTQSVLPRDMDPKNQLLVKRFYGWIGNITPLVAFFGAIPMFLHNVRGGASVFWMVFVYASSFGIVLGLFEINTGLTPDFSWSSGTMDGNRFYVVPARATKVGMWRVVSSSLLIGVVLVIGHLLWYW